MGRLNQSTFQMEVISVELCLYQSTSLTCPFIPCGVCVQGLATAFFSDSDAGIARSLMETLSETNQTVPGWLQNFASRMPGYGGGKGRRGGGRFGGRDARKEYGGGGYGAPAAGGYGGQAGGGYGGGGNNY